MLKLNEHELETLAVLAPGRGDWGRGCFTVSYFKFFVFIFFYIPRFVGFGMFPICDSMDSILVYP